MKRRTRSEYRFEKRRFVTLLLTASLTLTGINWLKANAAVHALPERSVESQNYDQIAVQAYIYGYPLVVLSRLRKLHTLSKQGMEGIRAPINTFAHMSRLLTAKDPRDTITPNHDTIQSNAWLDLRSEPQVLSVPSMTGRFANTGGRYYVLWFVDAYSNVFKNLGRRSTGSRSGTYLITGPDWNGSVPQGLVVIKSPTNYVWLRGHTYVDVYDDTDKTLSSIRKITLTPLSSYARNAQPAPITGTQSTGTVLNPQDVDTAGIGFFDEMCEALKENPPPASDAQLLAQFETIGIGPGRVPSVEVKDPQILSALTASAKTAQKMITEKLGNLEQKVNGWEYTFKTGSYGQDFLLRAAMAKIGPGVNVREEVTGALTRTDQNGEQLIGEREYVIRMDKAHIPPVDASWSLTLYSSSDSFFFDNPLNRYSVGGTTRGLVSNPDGSMDIYIQYKRPDQTRLRPNWIPAPKGPFYLVFRAYMPRAEIFNGRYEFPSVEHKK